MGEGTTPSGWRDIDRRHRAGILLGVAVVLVAVVVGAIVFVDGAPLASSGGDTTRTITPAEQTTETLAPEPSYEPTGASDAESSGASGEGGAAAAPDGEGVTRPAGSGDASAGKQDTPPSTRILYRRDGWLCVSTPDGAGEQLVAESQSGPFSLSPDGGTIASVDGDGELRLYDVATGRAITAGPAMADRPSWSPDSRWLVYTAAGPKVIRIDRRGEGSRTLLAGRLPAVSMDGSMVVAASPVTQEPAVLIWRSGSVERYSAEAPITGLACGDARIHIGTGPTETGDSALRSIALTGGDERVEVRYTGGMRGVSIGSLLASPHGDWIVYAEQGDDGYSRVYALPDCGGVAIGLSGRRDTYPLQWSPTGGEMLLTEGNPSQGEATEVVAVTVPGGARRLVVEGAGR